MTGGSIFKRAKIICRGESSKGESSRASETPPTPVHLNTQEENKCGGSQQPPGHSYHWQARNSDDGIWLIDEEGAPIRRRGRTTCVDIHNMPPGTRVYIEVNGNNIPCNKPESILLGSYLSFIARDPIFAPISFLDWSDKGMKLFKKRMLAKVLSKFEFPVHMRHWILQSLDLKWSNHKMTLKSKYWDNRPIEKIMESVPDGVDAAQWCQLVVQWSELEEQIQPCELCAEEGFTPEDNVEANETVFNMVRGSEHHGRVRPQGVESVDVIQTRYFPQSTTEGGSGSGSLSNLDQIENLREEVLLLRAETRDFIRQFQMQRTLPGSLQMGDNENPSDD
ncbi:uncharacterized protein LOC110105475 [Dendrobium catenatum]|uniref:Uncharacterized protein n=1 Tax=Dendrobium catenatum TaxID=906689 RepID=A0A2I0WU96_9ASPA|nr:uncharacterized protein LOC110105475 [Dendrobium catenatum]PKU79227.1 hypothetical protein MA16_Dca000571 [Dendrobium catenatum]